MARKRKIEPPPNQKLTPLSPPPKKKKKKQKQYTLKAHLREPFKTWSNMPWPLAKYNRFLLALRSLPTRCIGKMLPFISKTGIACLFDCAHNIRLQSGMKRGKYNRLADFARACNSMLYYLDNAVTPFDERRAFLEGKKGCQLVPGLLLYGQPIMAKSLRNEKVKKRIKLDSKTLDSK